MKPSSVAKKRTTSICLFGDPKVGKSTLAAKLLLAGFKLTWISMDNGHEVIFKLPIPIEKLDEQLNIIILPDTKENPVAISTCLKIATGAAVNICDVHGVVDCPVCKSKKEAASWSRVCCNEFGPQDIIVYDHLGQLSTSAMTAAFKKANKPDTEKPEWDQYGSQGLMLEKFLTNIQQAAYNVICITHVDEVEMEDKSKKLVPLCGTTKFSRNTGKYFDHLIYCHMRNGRHAFGSMTGYQVNLVNGSRTDIAIEKMSEPSLVPFFDGTISSEKEAPAEEASRVLSSLSSKMLAATVEKSESRILPTHSPTVTTLMEKVNSPIETPEVVPPITTSPTVSTPAPAATTSAAVDRAKLLASLMKKKG